MSTLDKPRGDTDGKPQPELSRFKDLWPKLSEDARCYWRQLFSSRTKQPAIRAEILAKLKVRLDYDKQLTYFRAWLQLQDTMDQQAEDAAEFERRIVAEHPDWTKDQVREDLIKRFYNQARATGDAKLGLKTIAADMKVEALKFDQEKFKEGLRTKLESGLAELAQHIKSNPKAQAAYESLKLELKAATK